MSIDLWYSSSSLDSSQASVSWAGVESRLPGRAEPLTIITDHWALNTSSPDRCELGGNTADSTPVYDRKDNVEEDKEQIFRSWRSLLWEPVWSDSIRWTNAENWRVNRIETRTCSVLTSLLAQFVWLAHLSAFELARTKLPSSNLRYVYQAVHIWFLLLEALGLSLLDYNDKFMPITLITPPGTLPAENVIWEDGSWSGPDIWLGSLPSREHDVQLATIVWLSSACGIWTG